MTAINQNAEIRAGDSNVLDISLFEANGTTPLDVSGATVNWALSSIYDLSVILLRKSSVSPSEITVTTPSSGEIQVFIEPGDTDTLGGQPYYHEVEVVGGATTITVTVGQITIRKTAMH